MRQGTDYIESLKDGRSVFLDGTRVDDVTTHPAFRQQVQRVAAMYDAARSSGPTVEGDDEAFSPMWLIPRTVEDLALRRQTHRFWAEMSYGLMGRTPDHVATVLSSWAGSPHVFGRGGEQFADNVVRFYERMKREDAYVAYVIVPPQVDRSKPAHQQPEPFLYVGAAEEREDGIVLRGAQMIGTSAVLADYLLVTYITPLQEGDEDHAISVVVPCNAQGLKMYPRRPYAEIANSRFDYPLSSQFDEIDSMIVFDDVFVPWDQVFVYRDVDLVRAQFNETGSHVLANFQSLVRFGVKLDFSAGLAKRLADTHGIGKIPPVQGNLGGKIAVACAEIQALTAAAEAQAEIRNGIAWPRPQFVYSGMSLQRRLVVDLMRELRELAGGSFLSVPSSEIAFASPETAADTERYYQGAGIAAKDRIKFLKLMWDFVGTEFAGRQLQYEMFYSAAQHVVDMRVFGSFDWSEGERLVEKALSEYDVSTPPLVAVDG